MNEVATSVITIDPDFAAIWGDLEGTALEGLRTEIMVDGIRDPLVIWNKDNQHILVDGHNRLRIAKGMNLPVVPVSYKVFKDKAEAAIWIISHQESRRNMTDWQKYKAVEVYHRIVKEKASQAQATSTGGNNPQLLAKSPKAETERINTRKEVSKASGLSEWKVRQGDYIRDKATDEQKAALDSGQKTMKEVYKETVKANAPKNDEIVRKYEQIAEATKQDGKTVDLQKAKTHKEAEAFLEEQKAFEIDRIIANIIRECRKLTDSDFELLYRVYSERGDPAYLPHARTVWDAGQKLIQLGKWIQEVNKGK